MSEQALVAACATGDPAALGALFDRHHSGVYRFLSRITRCRSEDLDDLVQATFIQVAGASPGYRGGGAVRTWIFGIAANIARHHARGELRRRAALAEVVNRRPPAPQTPQDSLEQRELLERIDVALRELPHDLRVAFVLCDLEQARGVDAARALGVTDATLWRRLHEARKALRAAIAEAQR